MPLDELFAEANRQLTICNSCRYCEGYCPVWPALELRTELSHGDITHLANLCHDCRDCFHACMYTGPHEFALNPPQVFASVRSGTYQDHVWPRQVPAFLRGRTGIAVLALVVGAVLLALALLLRDDARAATTGSPYGLLPHWVLVGVVSAPVLWGIAVTAVATARYWRAVHGRLAGLGHPAAWASSLVDGVRLRHMRGGGEECTYPDEEPSRLRRRFHGAMLGGLLLCLASTVSAAVQQEFLGMLPPYPLLSVPPVTGTLGGIGIVVGCTGLLWLKRRGDPGLSTERMRRADYGLLVCLLLLSVTGLLTLALRSTEAFLAILFLHLVAVIGCFTLAPYTKFMHAVYRLLSIYKDRLDQAGHPST